MVFSSSIQHLIAGTLGGFAATVSMYPLELIKTRMQVMADKDAAYRTMRSALRTVVRHEGFTGLYKGVTPAMLAASGSWGGYFYFYERIKHRKLQTATELGTVDFLLAGVEAGSYMVLIFNPIWVVKTRLALQVEASAASTSAGQQANYQGMADALRTIYRQEGVAGLYKGLLPALFLTSHGAIQFTLYEHMKALLLGSRWEDGWYMSMVLGAASKILAATVTYPYQVIKSKLQARDSHQMSRYLGTVDCIRKTWRSEGLLGFFRGVTPNALKVAPGSAVTFLVYEEVRKLLKAQDAG